MESQKGVCKEDTLAVFATITVNVVHVHILPLPVQVSQTNNGGKSSSNGRPPRGRSPSRTRLQKQRQDYLKRLAQIHRVIIGIFPCARISNHEQAANFAISVHSCERRRVDS